MKIIKVTLILLLSMSYLALLYLEYYVPVWYKRLT
jgi:hypothetical protein